eukprot:c21620_g1_i1 orf=249-689(-)
MVLNVNSAFQKMYIMNNNKDNNAFIEPSLTRLPYKKHNTKISLLWMLCALLQLPMLLPGRSKPKTPPKELNYRPTGIPPASFKVKLFASMILKNEHVSAALESLCYSESPNNLHNWGTTHWTFSTVLHQLSCTFQASTHMSTPEQK